ncbi:MAG: hypothetical protein FJ206_01200 [Gemmatimonadetes bacterium]|nr:hypothetical protein [Gemmatimonadota bacterium]
MPIPVRLTLVAALVALPAMAQHPTRGGGQRASLPGPEAKQFDFLIGQWQLVVRPKVSSLAARIHGAPKLAGTLKAWRAFDGFGVEDELRVVDGSGNPTAYSHALRVYDLASGRWQITTLDVYRARFSTATAQWNGTEMVTTGTGTDPEGRPIQTRTRFTAITKDGFRMVQDRSADDGKNWEAAVLSIEAKRVAATAPR